MPDDDAATQIAACRDGVLLDTNVLLLLLVGMIGSQAVEACGRTKSAYTVEDYEQLALLISKAQRFVVTPHIATETWNLGENALYGKYQKQFKDNFVRFVVAARERWLETTTLSGAEYFQRLGVADSGIVRIKRRRPVVVTDDSSLTRQLEAKRLPVVNFTNFRDFG